MVLVLKARDIAHLHAVSKRLSTITRDHELWRGRCFEDSYSETARRWRGIQAGIPHAAPDPNVLEIQRRVVELSTTRNSQHGANAERNGEPSKRTQSPSNPELERVRAMVNWDPSYSGEKVDWYGEYIARHAPVSVSWLQQPRVEGSAVSHGTRLVVSDGDGQIRWVERDGSSLVRRWNINQSVERTEAPGIFNTCVMEAGRGDVARKLLPTNANLDDGHLDHDELLLWTGERIGVLAFKGKPQFEEEDWEELMSAEEKAKRKEERIYGQTMRRALERQADEVRLVRGLGLGP